MKLHDAKIVAEICSTADGGCPACVKELAEELNDKFPKFRWVVVDNIWNQPSIYVEERK